MSKSARTFSRIEVEASEWLVGMSDRTVSLDRRARFEAWLAADPEHERVYKTQKLAWSAVAGMPQLFDETNSASKHPQRSASTIHAGSTQSVHHSTVVRGTAASRILALAAAVVLITTGVVFRNQIPRLGAGEAYETTVAQVKDVRLNDGTRVTLGASSHIDVAYTKNERRVVLDRGEAFFDVERDSARPFFVTAGSTLVRVVGTRFDVHYGPKAVRVSVAEGRVEVMEVGTSTPAAPSRNHRNIQVLSAGEAALAESSGPIRTTDAVKGQDLGAWRSGRLIYVDTYLRDVVSDINRYYNGKIEVADEATGDMQLTTSFRVDQIDRMLEVLEGALPVSATHTEDDRIVIIEKSAER